MELPHPDAIRRKLADLADSVETSDALQDYLRKASKRDVVDVMNEVECLARLIGSDAPKEKGEP